MAKRVTPKKTTPPALAPAEDIAILHPEKDIPIDGRLVTVREYAFSESLRLQRLLGPLVEALSDLVLGGKFSDHREITAVFGDHYQAVEELLAAACDQPVEWIRSRKPAEGQLLLDLWWVVNQDFFVQRVRTTLGVREAIRIREASAELKAQAVAGQTSTLS